MIKMTYEDLLTDVALTIFYSAAVKAIKMSQEGGGGLLKNTDRQCDSEQIRESKRGNERRHT